MAPHGKRELLLAVRPRYLKASKAEKSHILPVLKLQSKTRVDGKLKKKYDIAQTPYQRVLESPDVPAADKTTLRAIYLDLNPVHLRKQIDDQLDKVWALAVR